MMPMGYEIVTDIENCKKMTILFIFSMRKMLYKKELWRALCCSIIDSSHLFFSKNK